MGNSTAKWKLLLSTQDESEAYSLKSRLESEGVRCKLEAGDSIFSSGGEGLSRELKVFVPLNDFEACVQLVDADLDEDQ